LDANATLEYWKSAPYFVNFTEGYQLGEKLRRAMSDGEADELRPLVARTQHIDPAALARFGGGVSRAFGAFRERIPGGGTGASNIAGVQVEVGEKQAAVDLDIVVEYGASIVDLARAVRRNVISAVERMTGLEVIEVNIAVNDIQLPEAEDSTEALVVPAHPRVE